MVLDRFFPAIYAAFGVFLPLLTVQCAILAGSLFMVERSYTLAESVAFGVGSGRASPRGRHAGAIRSRLAYADLPEGLRGLGIGFILAGSCRWASRPLHRWRRAMTEIVVGSLTIVLLLILLTLGLLVARGACWCPTWRST
jgi:Na+-translocating ferredoxin:NAD+ oxidoreductase RnfE subunit